MRGLKMSSAVWCRVFKLLFPEGSILLQTIKIGDKFFFKVFCFQREKKLKKENYLQICSIEKQKKN